MGPDVLRFFDKVPDLSFLTGPYPGWAALLIGGILISPLAALALWAWSEGRKENRRKRKVE